MSQADEEMAYASHEQVLPRPEQQGDAGEWADLRRLLHWIGRRRLVPLVALVLIVAQLAWRAQFLSGMYFFRDDFVNLNLALKSPFSWHYLTYIGSGHLMMGERAIVWVVARVSLYNWGLASVISLAFVAAADVAAFRALRTLFGERPAILVPLVVYLLMPLEVAALGWWTVALETLPLQLATFMAISSQVTYVRTGDRRHLAAVVGWVIFGLVFFEKGLVVPLALFLLTSAFAAGGGSWLAGARRALVRYRAEWLIMAVLLAGYATLLAVALRTSTTHVTAPPSAGKVLTFAWDALRDTLTPGMLGGPWHWLALPGQWYALSAAPDELRWLSLVIVAVIAGLSILRRRIAWRAWTILALWVAMADIMPVVISRLSWSPILLGLDTRYLADAAPLVIICGALAFLAPASQYNSRARTAPGNPVSTTSDQRWRAAVAALLAVFVLGAIASNQAYETATTGRPAASFMANARLAIQRAPRDTPVVKSVLPLDFTYVASFAPISAVVGDIDPGKLRWIGKPDGTFDSLMMFGADGRLHPAQMSGVISAPRPAGQNCWARHHGQISVPFSRASLDSTSALRIGYLWVSRYPGYVKVRYGSSVKLVRVEPGLHGAYLPETGSATEVVIGGFSNVRMCVGDAEAGNLVPATSGPAIPASPLP